MTPGRSAIVTRDQALHASPAVWGLAWAAAGGVLFVIGWNVLEYRKQLREFGHR